MSKMLNGLVKIGGDSPEAGLCVDGFCALPPQTGNPPPAQTGEAPAQEAEDQAMRAKEEAATAPKGDGS